jgi:glutamyl-tRNA reductase
MPDTSAPLNRFELTALPHGVEGKRSSLRVVGVSHHTAPIEVREAVAVSPGQSADALRHIVPELAAEGVLISTCNRTELYLADGDGNRACDLLARLGTGVRACDLAGCYFDLHGERAVRHLFRVASSLDSLMPGETQIVGQVRRAHAVAREEKLAGRGLHGLFAAALEGARRVMAETTVSAGRHSVASLAVSYAADVLGDLGGRSVLCIGTGKMGRLVLGHLHARPPHDRPRRLTVASRSIEKAAAIAERFGGTAGILDDLGPMLREADLVVCATGSRTPVLTRSRLTEVMQRRAGRPMFVLDIAVPRDVEPTAGGVDGVFLYDLDDLRRTASQSADERRAELLKAESIVEATARRYIARHRGRHLGRLIGQLYDRGHATAEAEVERMLGKLPDDLTSDQREVAERQAREMARRLVNKLLHQPASSLNHARLGSHHPMYQHAAEKLFGVE